MKSIMLALLAAASAAPAVPSDLVIRASGAALQADARGALEILKDADPSSMDAEDARFVACMRQRFAGPDASKPAGGTLADRALAIYSSYWRAALMAPETREEQERRLEASLRGLLHAGASADLDSLLEQRIRSNGGHSLEGRTGLLRELMLWDRQDEKMVDVQLPEGAYRVKVFLLDGFRSFGWSHYATCGRRATGGWTTNDALYAVVPRYKSLDSEEFRVSFLGHEAQHFADKSRFRDLKPWELEYRAKLTELALADQTRTKILAKFIEDQGDDPQSPHSFANKKLLGDLVSRLGLRDSDELLKADPSRIEAAATATLREDSARRVAAGGLKVAS